MGVKRPLEEENLTQLSFEQPKQHDSKRKLTLVAEDFSSHPTAPALDSPDGIKSKSCGLDSDGMPESGGHGAFIADKELEASVPFSLVTSSSREEHVGNQDSSLFYTIPGFADFNIPRLPPEQFEGPYSCSLNGYPRKEVPIGADYQAEVPEWVPIATGTRFSGSNNLIEDEQEKILMGTCICPSPGLNDLSINAYTVGRGRTDCLCPDMGSVRCVLQHVKEARERLWYTIGDEAFTKLGFYEMGEEVVAARRWTSDDEQLFHKVVISNPASLGRDFWEHLTFVFPTRTKKELVSYYFNVFMLRRRGVQNRSYLLQIDSDDDEDLRFARVHYPSSQYLVEEDGGDGGDLQRSLGDFDHVGGAEDSDVESFSGSELDGGWVDCYGSESEYVCEVNGNCCNQSPSIGLLEKKDDDDEARNPILGGNVPKQDPLHIEAETAHMSGLENK